MDYSAVSDKETIQLFNHSCRALGWHFGEMFTERI